MSNKRFKSPVPPHLELVDANQAYVMEFAKELTNPIIKAAGRYPPKMSEEKREIL